MTSQTDGTASTEEFMDKVFGDYVGANAIFMAAIGDRLGLFKDLAAAGPATSVELAGRTGLAERYVREWLHGMAAAGYLTFDANGGRYAMPVDHVPVLAEESGTMFMGAAFFDYSTTFGESFHALLEAFRSGRASGRSCTARRRPRRSSASPRPGSSTSSSRSGCRSCPRCAPRWRWERGSVTSAAGRDVR
ncbi:hypothetical protein [Nonomuraea recticatena]|uniref:hypothetical protein n=1 Tax=Nonomuraea recticatena TaxID=46178 RepID=UPI00360D0AED